MRWVRFQTDDGRIGIGGWHQERVVPLVVDGALVSSLRMVMSGDPRVANWLVDWESKLTLDQPFRLLAPIDAPEKILCVGLNYRAHAIETGKTPPTKPVIFAKLPSALIGPGDAIVLPELSDQVDFEAELVVVIGRQCRHVSEDQANEYVFGYSCGHDVSARDWQYQHGGGQWLLGKSFDTFAPLGPYVVTHDSVPNAQDLRIQMHVSGVTMQDSRTNDLIFSIPFLISYLSQIFTLKAGDLIYTGTPSGVGVARTPQRFLQPGDECVVEIEGLGRLANPVTKA